MTMAVEVRVPALGESVSEATVATWFKKPGDSVAVDEMLCELETDKVTVEVPSPVAGKLAEIVAPEGETVTPNALLAQIAEVGNAGPEEMLPKHDAGAKPQEGQKKMSGKSIDVMVPTLGESVTEATVATWFKKVGDSVAQDEMLCELETDKVSVEVPSPAAGVLAEILADEGATVDATARLAIITEGAAGAAPAPSKAEPEAKKAAAVESPGAGPETPKPRADVEDAPSAKKAMAEAGVSRAQLSAESFLQEHELPVINLADGKFAVSYQFDLFGKLKRGAEAARADEQSVAAARDLAQVSVVAQVADSYLEICHANHELHVAEHSLQLQQRSRSVIERLIAAGRGTPPELARATIASTPSTPTTCAP